jgi:NAD(P)-dependent dehydrogenase (short-subunit alcohol dehydrogenase family)
MTTALTVLVTGASSGIGRAVAAEFAARKHTVFATARRPQPLADLAATTPGVHPITMDVTDPESVRAAWAKIDAQTGGNGVDILVNNAGFALTGPLELLDPADLRRQLDTNVFGLVAVTQAALPAMRARRSGRILNISSMLGRMTLPGMGAYSATKYAVESLSDALRVEVAEFGIDVIVIEPGFVATNLAHAADNQPATPASDAHPYTTLVRRGDAYLADQMAKAQPAERIAAGIVEEALRRLADAAKRRVLALN